MCLLKLGKCFINEVINIFERCGFLYVSFSFGDAEKKRMAQRLIWNYRERDKKPLFSIIKL